MKGHERETTLNEREKERERRLAFIISVSSLVTVTSFTVPKSFIWTSSSLYISASSPNTCMFRKCIHLESDHAPKKIKMNSMLILK